MAGHVNWKRWPARSVLGSLLLHALLVGVGASRHHSQPAVVPVAAPTKADTELEVEVEAEAALVVPDTGSAAVAATRELERVHSGVVASPSPSSSSSAAVAATEDDAVAGDDATEIGVAPSAAAAPATSAASPHLSLAQLGVEGSNLFLDRGDPAAARIAKAARTKKRLDQALAQGLNDGDVARGRGTGGPVLRSIEASVYASTVPLNGSASFVFVIDSEGKLVSGVLGNASSDRESWARVARQTAQAFAQRKLSVPKGKGIKLVVAVTSHLELPSGADPGLELSAQGLPLKKGGGPRSTKLDISIFPFPAATLAGDPADLNARARRMVHAHVVSEEVL